MFVNIFKYFLCSNILLGSKINYLPETVNRQIEINYKNNNLHPIDLYTTNIINVIYENIGSIEIYGKYSWYSNIFYENNLKNPIWNYIFFFKNNHPSENISKLIINSETQLEFLYDYNPVVVSEIKLSEEKSIMNFIYMLKNQDIIHIKVEKQIKKIKDKKTIKTIYKYYITNIEVKNFQYIFHILKYVNNYSIGSKISNEIMEKIKNISLIMDSKNNNKYYYIYFSLPHDYGECIKPHEIENSKNILYVLVINENNIIENIIYKPYCCLK